MNKDLEQRLVPIGEYRDAQNVMISRSEGDDVGALENVLGNALLKQFTIGGDVPDCCGEEVIGYFMDFINDRIFVFTTNFSDTSTDQLSEFAPTSAKCGIFEYNLKTELTTKLVEGSFLNFSKTHEITGVNVIEQYLYWTDNRNQPRKINTNSALVSGYYNNEDQITVSKYYPFESPLFIKKEIVQFNLVNAGENYVVGQIYETQGPLLPPNPGTGLRVQVVNSVGPSGEIQPITDDPATTGLRIIDLGVNYESGQLSIVNPAGGLQATINIVTDWVSSMYDRTTSLLPDGVAQNPNYDPSWDGDKNFMKDKFIRFAYRFKFDDGEYSLISVMLPSPYETWATSVDRMHIREIDIIYKQSNEQTLRVAQTIIAKEADTEGLLNSKFFQYKYKSEAPYKSLPNKDLLRVYDKVPVRALTQEFAENRVIYGNFFDKPTPPSTIDYVVSASQKDGENIENLRKEYQNHTLKQNRSYQGGIVLSDRYGRKSSVILSNDDASTFYHEFKQGLQKGCSVAGDPATFPTSNNTFSNYNGTLFGPATENNLLGPWSATGPTSTWAGDAINYTFISPITSTFNSQAGTPGMYVGQGWIDPDAIEWISKGTGYAPTAFIPGTFAGQGSGTGLNLLIQSTTGVPGPIDQIAITDVGYNYEQGDIINIPGGDNNASFKLLNLQKPNPLGWYSWTAVVKQPENDYYNVYTPGILNGFIDGEGPNAGWSDNRHFVGATPSLPTAHFALIGDNINKIPRDLSLVGPTQNLFRSGRPSVKDDPSYYEFVDTTGEAFTVNPYEQEAETLLKQRDRELQLDSGSQINNALVSLSPRVINSSIIMDPTTTYTDMIQTQWYPDQQYSTAVTIGTGQELGLWDPSAVPPYNTAPVFYSWENNPLIAKINIAPTLQALNSGCVDNELRYFGRYGPSPDAGLITYSVCDTCVIAGSTGDEYVPKSRNVGGKVQPNSSTHPAPYDKTGEAGQGILFNIEGVKDIASGNFSSDDSSYGELIDGGINVSNTEGQNGVKGFVSPQNFYPYQVDVKITGAGDGNGEVKLTIDKEEWPGLMEPELAILETKALESKLDIYWETSSSGLLSELNFQITNGDEFTPVRLGRVPSGGLSYQQNEEFDIGTNIFGEFSDPPIGAFSSAGTIIDNSTMPGPVTMTLTQVLSGTVDVSSRFSLVPDGTSGHYKLNTNAFFAYCNGEALTFEFFITVKSPSPTYPVDGSFIYTEVVLGPYTLLNKSPKIASCPLPYSFSKSGSGPGPWGVYNSSASNGTIMTNPNLYCGITWKDYGTGERARITDVSTGLTIPSGPNTWTYSLVQPYLIQVFFQQDIPLGTYTLEVEVLDDGGLTDTCTTEITVTS